ncbi:anthocyanidin 3-O-glucoside 2'''-O-xylosyltransferase-like [Lycium ferocissimum]|uniref:anthocyanidin 3-O-glucoside 2'''-O-xylosyltransferase-like n=1 Tax=Lycium ferocissimum TaxID=112874 RepID=UPI0028159B7E|nr:anthocyanidin 3-O-glucoside 2'''-O-xylosyltransferase-like [Lycium ferocissimum]
MAKSTDSNLQIVMFPWLAFGHMIPFLNLSNELAKRGHKISFLLPKNAQIRLQNQNLHPNLITFHTLTIPHINGLPYGAETTADVPRSLESLLITAMDELYDQIKSFLQNLKPHFVFFDLAHWIPDLVLEIGGIKTVCYKVVCPATSAISLIRSPDKSVFMASTAAEIVKPPPGYPSTAVVFHEREAKLLSFLFNEYGRGVTIFERLKKGITRCDAIALKTCREIEGTFGDYIATQFKKPVLYTGPVLPEPAKEPLEEHRLSNWLEKFDPGSVVFCAFGTQLILEKNQFQELVLGLEMTDLPFLVVVRPPEGTNSVEEALPEGFKERVQEKGLILDCWVPQLKILSHKSVGCFVSHCGYGSMWESLALCDCQLVLLPRANDQTLNARLMEKELKVGVEVEKDENGWFSKESLCKAVKCVMDKDSQIGCFVKENHRKWKEVLSSPGFMSNYIDNFIQNLHGLLVE